MVRDFLMYYFDLIVRIIRLEMPWMMLFLLFHWYFTIRIVQYLHQIHTVSFISCHQFDSQFDCQLIINSTNGPLKLVVILILYYFNCLLPHSLLSLFDIAYENSLLTIVSKP